MTLFLSFFISISAFGSDTPITAVTLENAVPKLVAFEGLAPIDTNILIDTAPNLSDSVTTGSVVNPPPVKVLLSPPAKPKTSPPNKTFSYKGGGRNRGGSFKVINGCNKSVFIQLGRGSDRKCGKGIVNPAFAKHMETALPRCIFKSAAAARIAKPVRVHINHMGTYGYRTIARRKRLSNHAYSRAIDIGAFVLTDARGNRTKISTHIRKFRGKTKTFYNKFRSCWKKSLRSKCRRKGSIGHVASRLGGNRAHADHIHLEFPKSCGR